MTNSKTIPQDTRKIFWKKGTCSHTMFHILNREFGYLKENEEHASDPLAGGLMQTGHQCGMLWGSSLAAGAESFRRCHDSSQAIASAITATQHLMESFSKRTKTVDCREITGCDLTSKTGMTKLMVKSILCGFIYSPCFNLAVKWAPEAIRSARQGLSNDQTEEHRLMVSCASEVVRKMGGNNEEMIMVAGFAGGLGLSGNACGALAAAIWMNTLGWRREQPEKTRHYFKNPDTNEILNAFYEATGSEIRCDKISEKCFKTAADHSEFINNGGCDKLIGLLAKYSLTNSPS
jgi:hypothetical protein